MYYYYHKHDYCILLLKFLYFINIRGTIPVIYIWLVICQRVCWRSGLFLVSSCVVDIQRTLPSLMCGKSLYENYDAVIFDFISFFHFFLYLLPSISPFTSFFFLPPSLPPSLPLSLRFSSGGTKSVLHTDSLENFHCVVTGRKEFVMFEPQYSKSIGPEHENLGYYFIDVEA